MRCFFSLNEDGEIALFAIDIHLLPVGQHILLVRRVVHNVFLQIVIFRQKTQSHTVISPFGISGGAQVTSIPLVTDVIETFVGTLPGPRITTSIVAD
jgi:hypothetical protein